jgi:hypothetical protein
LNRKEICPQSTVLPGTALLRKIPLRFKLLRDHHGDL